MDDELEQLYDSFYGQLQSTLDDVNASLPPIVCKTQLPPMPQQAAPWPPRSNGEQRQQSATWSSRPNSSQLSQGRAGASATNTTKGNYKQSAASALDTAARNVPLPALNTVSQQGASLDVPQPVDPQLTRMSSAQTSSSAMLGQVLPVSSTLPLTAPFTGRNVYSADAINAMTTKMAGETGVGMARVAAGVIAASVSTQTGARQPPPPPEGHPDDVVVPPLPIEPSIRSTDELPAMTSMYIMTLCPSLLNTHIPNFCFTGGLLTLADDLLQNDGRKFLEMMERLALHQRYMHDGTAAEDAELDYAAAYADMDDAHLGGTFPPALHEYIDDGVTGEEDEDDDEDDDCDDEEDFDDDDLDDDGADDEVFFREDIGDADNDLGEEDDEDYFSSEHDDDDVCESGWNSLLVSFLA